MFGSLDNKKPALGGLDMDAIFQVINPVTLGGIVAMLLVAWLFK